MEMDCENCRSGYYDESCCEECTDYDNFSRFVEGDIIKIFKEWFVFVNDEWFPLYYVKQMNSWDLAFYEREMKRREWIRKSWTYLNIEK